MGTYIELYKHPRAAWFVPGYNEWRRMWTQGPLSMEKSRAKLKELNVLEGESLPKELEKAALFPSGQKYAGHLMFEDHGAMPLWAMFGFPSVEPEDIYLVPDWGAVLRHIEEGLNSFMSTLYHKRKPAHDDQLHALQDFQTSVKWILEQKNKHEYLVCWSW